MKYKTRKNKDSHFNPEYHAPLTLNGKTDGKFDGEYDYSNIIEHIDHFISRDNIVLLTREAVNNKVNHINTLEYDDIVLLDPTEHSEIREYSPNVIYIVRSVDDEMVHLVPYDVEELLLAKRIKPKVANLYQLKIQRNRKDITLVSPYYIDECEIELRGVFEGLAAI